MNAEKTREQTPQRKRLVRRLSKMTKAKLAEAVLRSLRNR